MASRDDLKEWVVDALRRGGGELKLLDIARDIWTNHEKELEASGDLFFSWQYDMRWACTALRDSGDIEPPEKRGVWKLVSGH